MKTLEDVAKMDPNDIVYAARNEMRKSPALRKIMGENMTQLQADIGVAVGKAADQGVQLRAWQVQEKLTAGRMAMLVAVIMGHPREALDAGRRAAGLVLLGEDGQPI